MWNILIYYVVFFQIFFVTNTSLDEIPSAIRSKVLRDKKYIVLLLHIFPNQIFYVHQNKLNKK